MCIKKGKFKKQKSHVSNISGGTFYHKISLEILETSHSINHLPDSVDFFNHYIVKFMEGKQW